MGFNPTLTAVISEDFDVPDSEATVTLKYLKSGVMSNITQASMQLTSKQQDAGGMNAEIAFNMSKKNRDICLACVTGWSGFTDDEKNKMKFSQSNLLKMMDESEEFVNWIIEKQEKLTSTVEGEEEEVEKN